MEAGYLLDTTYGNRHPLRWVEGAPERSLWVGLTLKDRDVFEVATYRCTACGLLKSYAHPAS